MIISLMSARRVRRLLLGLAVLPVAAIAQAPDDLPPLPEDLLPELRPYLISALTQAPQMVLSNINLASAEATRMEDDAGLWPSVSGGANYSASKATVSSSSNVSSTSSGVFYSLGISQALFQWGAVKNRAISGRVGVELAEHQYADAYRNLLVSLRVQYLSLIQKKITLRNAEFSLKLAEDGLATAEAQLKSGRISPEAMMEPRLGVDGARVARDQALEDLEHSRRVFLLMVGRDDLNVDAIAGEIPRPGYAPQLVDQLLQRFEHTGVNETLTALSYRDYIRQADIDYRIIRTNLLPKLSFGAGVSEANVTSASANSVSQVGVYSNYWNVVASWSIFDGFSTRGAKLATLLRKRSYERTLQNISAQALLDARDLRQQLDFAWRNEAIGETRRDVSVATVKRLQEQLKIGKASQSGINAALLNSYGLDLYLASLRATYLTYWSQYLSTLGVDPMINTVPASFLKNAK